MFVQNNLGHFLLFAMTAEMSGTGCLFVCINFWTEGYW